MIKTTLQNDIDVTDRNAWREERRSVVVQRDCRRGETRRDVAAVLAAFDEGQSLDHRRGDLIADRLFRVLES